MNFPDLLSTSGLSLDRLQSFCLVAEAGGVTKAAKGEAARQSQFSRQLKELEEFFGVELMRRSGRGVTLTEAGRRLHVLAREHFAALGDFKADCASEPARLTVAAGDSLNRLAERPAAPTRPNEVWVTDFTYIPTAEGWLFLAVVLDLYSRRVVGWAFATALNTALALAALAMALTHRRPPRRAAAPQRSRQPISQRRLPS